jgi:hypothetical protein
VLAVPRRVLFIFDLVALQVANYPREEEQERDAGKPWGLR